MRCFGFDFSECNYDVKNSVCYWEWGWDGMGWDGMGWCWCEGLKLHRTLKYVENL